MRSLQVQIHFPASEKPYRNGTGGGYDWRYSLRLQARLANSELLSTSAICEASDSFVDRVVPALSCYIDCDGGSVTVWRKFGRERALGAVRAGRAAEDRRQLRRRRGGVYRGGDGGARVSGAMYAQQQCKEN